MTATIQQARNEIIAQFRTTWLADGNSSGIPILFANVGGQVIPTSGAWVRITVQHTEGSQPTLSGATGARRFRRFGFVTVQVFTPTGFSTLADVLTMIAASAFEGITTSPGRVMFLRVRPVEIGQEGNWFQTNVLSDFQYDEVR